MILFETAIPLCPLRGEWCQFTCTACTLTSFSKDLLWKNNDILWMSSDLSHCLKALRHSYRPDKKENTGIVKSKLDVFIQKKLKIEGCVFVQNVWQRYGNTISTTLRYSTCHHLPMLPCIISCSLRRQHILSVLWSFPQLSAYTLRFCTTILKLSIFVFFLNGPYFCEFIPSKVLIILSLSSSSKRFFWDFVL